MHMKEHPTHLNAENEPLRIEIVLMTHLFDCYFLVGTLRPQQLLSSSHRSLFHALTPVQPTPSVSGAIKRQLAGPQLTPDGLIKFPTLVAT